MARLVPQHKICPKTVRFIWHTRMAAKLVSLVIWLIILRMPTLYMTNKATDIMQTDLRVGA
jgi:hypothetical protein